MTSKIEPTSSLYLHPSDGISSVVVDKLEGPGDYRSWRRSMEVALSAKCKLGFVNGKVVKDKTDAEKAEHWDACNNMIIAWILGSVSAPIKKSVMFIPTASQIWAQLEQRFSLTHGSRKYQLTKELYETKQGGKSINEYFTELKALWEELDTLNTLPTLTAMTTEMTNFVDTLNKQKQEQHLFLFLNGLDEVYGPFKSQMLLMDPLPTVDAACSTLQQEEAQRNILVSVKEDSEVVAMYSRGGDKGAKLCGACGKQGHTKDKCWHVVGFPSWHPKNSSTGGKGKLRENLGEGGSGKGNPKLKGNKNRTTYSSKVAANVQGNSGASGFEKTGASFTPQQIEQLIRMLPTTDKSGSGDTDDELDTSFASMVSCLFVGKNNEEWIIDSGASEHMTGNKDILKDAVTCVKKINLPTGQTSNISHKGEVNLKNSLKLKQVLHVPEFKFNLLSVHKLIKDGGYKVDFIQNHCVILDEKSGALKGIGQGRNGLYYLLNEPIEKSLKRLGKNENNGEEMKNKVRAMTAKSSINLPNEIIGVKTLSAGTLWHHRLGHAPMRRIGKIGDMKGLKKDDNEVCVTFPLAKFTKLPYGQSMSRANFPFDLIHIDIWGPYRVCARGKYRYFLTIVDDHSRLTWVQLLRRKSEAFESIQRPKQNGRVERKHKNILEMARAIRFQAGLPLHFWGECVMTAAYVTNRLPTEVIGNKTPYEVLHKKKP